MSASPLDWAAKLTVPATRYSASISAPGGVAGEPAGLPSGSELQFEGSLKFPAPPIQATACAMILSSRIFTTSRLEPSRRDPHPALRATFSRREKGLCYSAARPVLALP